MMDETCSGAFFAGLCTHACSTGLPRCHACTAQHGMARPSMTYRATPCHVRMHRTAPYHVLAFAQHTFMHAHIHTALGYLVGMEAASAVPVVTGLETCTITLVRTHLCTRTHARTHAHTHVHTHARTYTRMHARTHACTHAQDDLKAFSAAFGTTAAAPMFHIAGTVEACDGLCCGMRT